MLLDRNELSVSLERASRLALPRHTDTWERKEGQHGCHERGGCNAVSLVNAVVFYAVTEDQWIDKRAPEFLSLAFLSLWSIWAQSQKSSKYSVIPELTIQASAGSTEVQAGTALQGQYHRCDKSYLMETCSHCSNRREWGGHQQPAYEGRLVGCCAQGGTISGSNNNCQVECEDSAAEYKSKQLQKQSLFVKISTEISPSDGKHFIIITMKD